jgi:two-component system, NtrC family, sensor histidine kinase KinB
MHLVLGIRQKLLLGFGSLLCIVVILSLLIMHQIDKLGQAIDVILKENYRSVVACQDMKEALERIDSGLLFSLLYYKRESEHLIAENIKKFNSALDVESNNITLPGEKEKVENIKYLYKKYRESVDLVTDSNISYTERKNVYFTKALPIFQKLKDEAQATLEMNQQNMSEENDNARKLAASAHERMLLSILICALVAVTLSYLIHRWILIPVYQLTDSVKEIQQGNFDLIVEKRSGDEMGQLIDSFNVMTERLRQTRQSEKAKLARSRQATKEVFNALPTAIVVINFNGDIEISTEIAEKYFKLRSQTNIFELGIEWLSKMIKEVLDKDQLIEYKGAGSYIQKFINNKEYFFHPIAIPLRSEDKIQTGAVLILKDVTQAFEQQELKHSIISTVSHQLKSPLTSLRMSIHILLDGSIGQLNDKQVDLLMSARDDSERLVDIFNDLLDINRIESGKALHDLMPYAPYILVREAVEPFLSEAKDKGIEIHVEAPDDLPEVLADSNRIQHVFLNLLSNALRFTNPGGEIVIKAEPEDEVVRFTIQDNGIGIPKEYIDKVFDQFFRVPGQEDSSGAGLGLAIVKEIVNAHGGETGVRSDLGKGASFWFTLRRTEIVLHKDHNGVSDYRA